MPPEVKEIDEKIVGEDNKTSTDDFQKSYDEKLSQFLGDEESESVEIPPEEKESEKKTYKFGDIEIDDESEIKTILKLHKKEKPEEMEEVAANWNNYLNWKKDMEEKGRKFNLDRASFESERKQYASDKEELVNRQKQLREDLQKETEINKSYDTQIKQIKDEIKTKRAEFDFDEPDAFNQYEDLRFDLQSKIAVLELKRENELSAHKSYMGKIEAEEKEKQERLARENLYNLAANFADKIDANKILEQHIQFQNLTPEQKQDSKVLESFPDYKEYLVLRDFAIKSGIVNLSNAYELRYLREMVGTYIGEKADWDKKIAEIKKSGYNEAVNEIKAKGVSFFETEDESKKTITPGPEKDFESKYKGLLKKLNL